MLHFRRLTHLSRLYVPLLLLVAGHHPLPGPQLILVLREFPVISGLVLGGLHLEPLQFIFGDHLPEAADLFHDIERGDVGVSRHNLGSCLTKR